ncbi:hypothetical protein [Williamsia sterculiae]|uniref:Uncharacterized protein n=1 Tax=Williamsia sterculiae TaxID=1344003 RepID=A0A1N7HCQ6_9NOCA|nr:hypothetical protein [Williamsia sterculiae]SIS22553.1 hypothetical protein SAMN05445060_3974 [Williamsia sterculiae]
MLIWGWGRRNKQIAFGDGRLLLCNYRYFHLMFVFTVAWGQQYSIGTPTPYGLAWQPIADSYVPALTNGNQFGPSGWERFSLLGACVLGFVLIALVGLAAALT